jgi:hypothetical protein
MNSTTSYTQARQRIIAQFWGTEDGITSLENAILNRPNVGNPRIKNGIKIYERATCVVMYNAFVCSSTKIIITYAVNDHNNVIFLDIR